MIPDVSFITVNYNGIDDTLQLIRSLKHTVESVSYEIIVVDNGSLKDETELINEYYPDVITIRSSVNVGFAGGNNIGIKQAIGRYFFFINNDTYIEDDGLKSIINRFESSPAVGGVSPKIKFAFNGQKIQFAGYSPLNHITMRNKAIGCNDCDAEKYNVPHQTPYMHGAAMIVKRKAIKEVGLMPDIFFLYYEELDWSTQFTKHGYELWYEPECTVFHMESQSIGQNSALRVFYMTRNRMLYPFRNYSKLTAALSIIYQTCVVAPKNIIVYLLHARTDLAKAVIKGVVSFFKLNDKRANYEWNY